MNFILQRGGELTPVHLSAKYGHLELSRLLIAHGAAPDVAANGASCMTPLHFAVMNGHSDVALLLLQSGASADSIAAVSKQQTSSCIIPN